MLAVNAISAVSQADRLENYGLPESIRVLVRGWLNCNQILLADGDAQVLIDSGYHTHSRQTLALLERHCQQLSRLINTHGHSDHVGGNAAVAERYGCPITVSALEAPDLDPWDDEAFWMGYADQYTPPFRYADTLSPGDTFLAGSTEWQAIAAPGHAMGALIFHSPQHRLLVTGDALWERGMGAVMPREGDNPELDAALATLEVIEKLDVAMVIPGHGKPFDDVAGAIRLARARLLALQADPRKNARHFMKVMFVFSLLAKGSMALADAFEYIDRVPVYGDLNRRFVCLPEKELAPTLIRELQWAGAIALTHKVIVPQMAA